MNNYTIIGAAELSVMSLAMKQPIKLLSVILIVALLGCSNGKTSPSTSKSSENTGSKLLVVSFNVTHNNLTMCVQSKRLESTEASPTNTLVLLPSATYSTAPNWDLQFAHSSIMDYFAESGWVVFAIDLPGYGKSSDPPIPETFGAIEAVEYIDAVVDHIAEAYKTDSVNLVGWSWGAQAAGHYANKHPERVRKLVLYGFNHQNRLPIDMLPQTPCRKIDFEGAKSDFVKGCYEQGIPEAYAAAVLESDDAAPSGPINDYVNRLPLVDPDQLPMPTLVICGQFELEQPPNEVGDYREFFEKRKRDLEEFCQRLPKGHKTIEIIDGGGHAVHLEKPRDKWRLSVLAFLESSTD